MRGVEFAELQTFLAVANERSFRQAADRLAISPSAISHTVRTLEDRLGAKLFNRTTRSVSLTEAGSRLQQRLLPAFAEIRGAVRETLEGADRPAGLLRLTAPRVAVQMVLMPVIAGFLQAYPDVRLEVTVDDMLVDSVAEGFDAGIRLDERVGRDMASVAVGGALRGILVAAPDYLTSAGVPTTIDALRDHRWLNYRQPTSGRLLPWEFEQDGEEQLLSLDGPLATNDADLLIAAAAGGAGIACVTEATVTQHLASGRLVRILNEWKQPFLGWRLYYPRSRHPAPALRALITFLTTDRSDISDQPPEAEQRRS